jgi:hypothetical protein
MRNLLLGTLFSVATLASAFASGYGYDSNGNYYNWQNNGLGGYGYDSQGNYYNWQNNPD